MGPISKPFILRMKLALRFSFWTQDTNWLGSLNDLTAGQVIWGSGSGSGMGRMNFHSATFAVTNSIVAITTPAR